MPGGKKGKYKTRTEQTMGDVSHTRDHILVEKGIHRVLHDAPKIARSVGRTIAKAAPKALPAIAKAAPSVLNAIPTIAKAAAPLLGGVPGAITAAFSGNAGVGGDYLAENPYIMTGETKEEYMAKKEMTAFLKDKAANPGRSQMYQAQLPKQKYSGQSAMGKAVMASAKKKV